MSYASTILADSPSGFWKLNDASGNAADSSGNGFTLTKNGTVTYGVGSVGADAQNAISLAGTGSFSSGPTTGPASLMGLATKGSLEFIVNRVAATRQDVGFSYNSGLHSYSMFVVQWYTDNVVYCEAGNNGGDTYWNYDASAITGLTHIVMTWDGTQGTAANRLKLYINGTSVGSLTAGGSDPATIMDAASELKFWIGHHDGDGADSTGTFADVSLYAGVVLTPTQVTAHYNAFVGGAPATPTSVASSATGTTTINVTWDTDDTETSCTVNIYAADGTTLLYTYTVDAGSGGADIAALTAGTTYKVGIIASNADGDSSESTLVSVTTDSLAAPTIISARATDSTHVTVTWDQSPLTAGSGSGANLSVLPSTSIPLTQTGVSGNKSFYSLNTGSISPLDTVLVMVQADMVENSDGVGNAGIDTGSVTFASVGGWLSRGRERLSRAR